MNGKKKEKITKKQFDDITKKYKNEVKKGLTGIGKDGKEIKDQTDWIWFSKEEIQNVLDEGKAGIRFYFSQYDESFGEELGEEYVGRLTLAMLPGDEKIVAEATSEEGESADAERDYAYNYGGICPPGC
ncbi:hypothetical protein [Echinicola salinicaeni]|uniref:hypothetical protein n=1 Tax=Echinicola salinicaeni TaxID=2762757 RepID=UPI001645A55C|nr:hypothetical protein [Echinicola salinicaeni]